MVRYVLCLATLFGTAAIMALGTANGKGMPLLLPDWLPLQFTCTMEQNRPVDPQADVWFLRARELEQQGVRSNDVEMAQLYQMSESYQ
ncbi:hypothetical protein [Serratia marcescens]|uniref:hypothetical protein n=1 Tax=Serratia marcescens TaxID=615 RepID=UPI0009F1E776|nr:hypothetical protein [Serratia marcescens]OQV32007.1 hypothetical protein BV901_19530 [Serratia nematodiphila]WGL76563.1 hypothetical protein QFB82_19160 [Serratia marcescens]